MKLNQIRAVSFDLDGTLIDSGPDLSLAINLMLEELNRDTFDTVLIHQWVGNGVPMLVKRALSGSEHVAQDLSDALYEDAKSRFERLYAENLCVNTKPYEGVVDTLQWLHEQNLPLAVVTNKPFAFTSPLLDQLGLSHYFDVILGGDSLEKRKPDPFPLQYVLDKRDLKPAQMLMVGDSRNDILAAKAAGCPSVGVTYGYNYGIPIQESDPDWAIDQFSLLQNILTNPSSM